MCVPVEVIVTEEFAAWYGDLTEGEQESVERKVAMLEHYGVALDYPHSSDIRDAKRCPGLRELRVQHAGEPYRVFYAFDPARQAVLLIGGRKTEKGARFYDEMIRVSERLWSEYLKSVGEDGR